MFISYSYTDIYRGQFAYHWQITLETPSNGYIQRIFFLGHLFKEYSRGI